MIKIVAFDIDNTLAANNKPVEAETISLLHHLRDMGVRIVLISGKPAIYLCGLARQLGLEDVVISGENGASIYYSNCVPPREEILLDIKQYKIKLLNSIRMNLVKQFGNNIWLQPNTINVSCFHKDEETKTLIDEYVKKLEKSEEFVNCFTLYKHHDCLEIVPSEVNKGNVVCKIMERENIRSSEIIAVGDSSNDFPMFDKCGISIGINTKGRYPVSYEFDNIQNAIKFIIYEIIGTENKLVSNKY